MEADPTPEEIRRLCDEIQQAWSSCTRETRRTGAIVPTWRPPFVSVQDLGPELPDDDKPDG